MNEDTIFLLIICLSVGAFCGFVVHLVINNERKY